MSAAAHALTADILQEAVEAHPKAVRPKVLPKWREAAGALLAGLLRLEAHGRAGAHGTSPKDFTPYPFGRDVFLQMVGAMEASGHLWKLTGWGKWQQANGKVFQHGGRLTVFRLTPKALEAVAAHGVALSGWREHWDAGKPQPVRHDPDEPRLILRGAKRRRGPIVEDGTDIPFDASHAAPARFLTDIEQTNRYLLDGRVGGIAFPGLRRIFNEGDQPGFAWRWGGRFYSLPGGDRYESLDGEERRSTITLNGEAVGEVDISASHLTFLHALLGEPLDTSKDPYALEGMDRELVKRWVSQALGKASSNARQWSNEAKAYYASVSPGRVLKDDVPIARLRDKVLLRHPLLSRLTSCGLGPLDLQFHEAEVLALAMKELRDRHDIATLPVHDSLVAPLSRLDEVEEVLKGAFSRYMAQELGRPCPIVPALRRKVP